MENPDVQQALIDTLKNLSETEEMSGTDTWKMNWRR